MNDSRYLLIDACNVIFATASLRKDLSTSLEVARDRLAELVRVIHDAEAVRIAMVLDSRSDQLEVEHPYKVKTFEYLYAPAELSADGVIERILKRVPEPGSVTVASNDNMVREATRASGALAIRPEELFEWSRACGRRLEQDALRRNQANAKAFHNRLDLDLAFDDDE
ncbi:MAG: NYN domain-containing protein [Verrucomicrobiota bacterium]